MIKPGSQNSRILRVLGDEHWHTTANLYRKCGGMILHSRISELRKHGFEIDHEVIPGKSGALGHRYRLLNSPSPADLDAIVGPVVNASSGIPREDVPRDLAHRFRIYKMVYDELVLLATASTAEDVGVAIVALGNEGQLAGGCLGLLDTHGTDEARGSWTVQPWDTAP